MVSDFRRIVFNGEILTFADFNREHERCLAFLKNAVSNSKADKKIVVTMCPINWDMSFMENMSHSILANISKCITTYEILRNMFAHYSATSVRQTCFGVKWGVKRPFSPQDNEKKYQNITPILSTRKKNLGISLVKTKPMRHSETSYKTAFLHGFDLAKQNSSLNKS